MTCVKYLSKWVLFLGRPNIVEESMQQVTRGLRVDLLFAEVNVRYFNWLGWCQAEHLLRVHTALKNISEDISRTGNELVTLKYRKIILKFSQKSCRCVEAEDI